MLDFFNKFLRPAPPSGSTAKERLRLVLLSDHLSLAPETVEALKRDLLAVISRYVEIDQSNADVTFERRDNDVAMLASVPITGVRRTPASGPDEPPPAPTQPERRRPEPVAVGVAADTRAADARAADVRSSERTMELPMHGEPLGDQRGPARQNDAFPQPAPSDGPQPKTSASAAAQRRRRRRRKANAMAKRNAQQNGGGGTMNTSAQA